MDIKKKIENIWFYHKIPIIIGVLVIVLGIYTISEKLSTPKYDHSIAIVSKENYPSQENVDKLKDIFSERLGGSVDTVIYNVALGEVGEDEVILSKLSLDISNKISEYFFIEDMDAFKKATNDLEFSEVTLVSDIDWLSNLGLDNFYLARR